MPDQQPQQPSTEKPRINQNRKYILVAEDDQFYANIYKVKLVKEGFDVSIVSDGVEVLKAARDRKPDLILLDLIMPIKDGFETLSDLKKDPDLSDIKVVILSNLGQEEDIKKVKQLGAIDYLVKSNISIQSVVDKIRQYLG